ncbi:MAG: PQQ-binding-like beta-propeller repeat protein [Planctomycetes bacterium]|nr:PQQ-binding-like beta-propeller repeat protein [Planctomycetota bacterium]
MSPEQAGGERPLSPQSDVYSLGAVLYECVTGRPPVERDRDIAQQIFAVMCKDPPRPSRVNPKTPRDLEVIIRCAMQKDRERRYASAEALAGDLDRFLAGEAIQGTLPGFTYHAKRSLRRNRFALAGAGVLAALVLAFLVFRATRPGHLTIETRPPDAMVWIDDDPEPVPAERAVRIELPAGSHRIRVERDGYRLAELPCNVESAGSSTVRVNLARLRQRVVLTTEPAECRLLFSCAAGSRLRFLSPLSGEWMDTDAYEVAVERPGFYRRRVSLSLGQDRPAALHVFLPPAELWKTREPQGSGFVVLPGGSAGERVAVLCVASGSLKFCRATDGAVLGAVDGLGAFPGGYAADLTGDGASEFLVVGQAGARLLSRAGEEIWRRDHSGFQWSFFRPEAGDLPPELWLVGQERREALDARTGQTLETWSAGLVDWMLLLEGKDPAERPYVCGEGPALVFYRARHEEIGRLETAPVRRARGALTSADLDGDGDRELLCIGRDGRIRAYAIHPPRLLWETEPGNPERMALSAGALAGGERPSIASFDDGLRVKVWDASGRLRFDWPVPEIGATEPILADWNADGRRELVYASAASVHVIDLFGGEELAEIPVPAKPEGYMALSDLDGDGLLDVLVSIVGGTVLAIPGEKTLWSRSIAGAVERAPVLADLDGDGLPEVVCASLDGQGRAFEARSGRLLWTVALEGEAAITPAIVGQDAIFASWAGVAKKVRGETGEVVWTYRALADGWDVHFQASPVAADVDRDGSPEILLADWRTDPEGKEPDTGAVHCLDAQSGEVRWVREAAGPFLAPPVPWRPGRILAGDAQGELALLDARDGSVLWRDWTYTKFASPARLLPEGAPGGPALVWSDAGTGRCLAISPGEGEGPKVEERALGDHPLCFRAGDRWIVVSAGPEGVRATDAGSGGELWRWMPDAPVVAAPAAADLDGDGGVEVVIADSAGRVTCLSAGTGDRLWEYDLGSGVEAGPVVADLDGDLSLEILLATVDGRVTAIRGRGHPWPGGWPAVNGDRFATEAPDTVGP